MASRNVKVAETFEDWLRRAANSLSRMEDTTVTGVEVSRRLGALLDGQNEDVLQSLHHAPRKVEP